MAELSLVGEVLWLAVDPGDGGLRPRHRRHRLRASLAIAAGGDRFAAGWRAGRAARRELIDAGLVEPAFLLRHLRLTDRAPAVLRFREIWAALEANDPSDPRIRDLAVLLAIAGVLAERLAPDERMIAHRRLRTVEDEGGLWRPRATDSVGRWDRVSLAGGADSFAGTGTGLVGHDHGGGGSHSHHGGGGHHGGGHHG